MKNKPQLDMKKVLVVGDSKVGKSNLIKRIASNSFSDEFESTIGIDYVIKFVNIGDKIIKLMLCDTAGQERFRTWTNGHFPRTDCVLIVYDVTELQTFNNIRDYWVPLVKAQAPENAKVILVGNKIGKEEVERKVDKAQGEKLAAELNIPFMETSAKTGQNVENLFMKIADWDGKNSSIFKLECLDLIFLCGVHHHEERVEDSLLQRAKNFFSPSAVEAEKKDPFMRLLLKSVHNSEMFFTEEIIPILFGNNL